MSLTSHEEIGRVGRVVQGCYEDPREDVTRMLRGKKSGDVIAARAEPAVTETRRSWSRTTLVEVPETDGRNRSNVRLCVRDSKQH